MLRQAHLRRSKHVAFVEAIYIAVSGGAPMKRVEAIDAVAGAGLAGDRYKERTGHWTGSDECQVTMIAAEALDHIRANTTVMVSNGEHRRNIITRGMALDDLAGRRLRIGGALLEFDRPRPPCRYIQSLSERGMTKALGGSRGGICARVVESGVISAGDPIELGADATEPAGRLGS